MEAETEGIDLAEKNMHFSREAVAHLLLGRVKAAMTLVCSKVLCIYIYLPKPISQTNK